MVMCNLIMKVTRGRRKDLVTAMILFMCIFATAADEDPIGNHGNNPKSAVRRCTECFGGEYCKADKEVIAASYLETIDENGGCTADIVSNYCTYLKHVYQRGFFTESERSGYCINQCNFLRYDCVEKTVEQSKVWAQYEGFVNRLMSRETDIPEIVEELDEHTLENWYKLLVYQWSIFLCLIPIVLNQYKYYNLWGAIGFLLFFLVLNSIGILPWEIAVHNIAVSFICIISGAGSTVVYESLVTTVIMLICLYCCFLNNIYIQLGAVLMILMGFCAVLYNSFYRSKGRATVNMLMLLVQAYLIYCQIDFLRREFVESSLVGIMVEMCLNAIVPYGPKSWWYMNAGYLTIEFVNKLTINILSKPIVFLCVYLLQFLALLGFRAFFGAFCLYVLRYKFTPESIFYGLYVYLADFYGSFRCVLRMLFNFERFNGKRVCYATGALFLLYREIKYARDFAMLRFVISTFDALFVQSSYYRSSHYLDLNINFMRREFPQQGAMPWVKLATLDSLSRFTSVIKVHTTNGIRKGVGCILNFKKNNPVMVTVDHVIKKASKVDFMGKTLSILNRNKLGQDDDDPVVSFDVLGNEFSDTATVNMLNPMEIDFIDTLVFINCNEENGNTVCFVPQFSFYQGLLYAAVDLGYGDSGGPCFAVLKSGDIRYCGAVSKGNGNDGGGNIISLVTRNPVVKYDSSDDEMTEELRKRVEDMDVARSVTIRPSVNMDEAQYPADDDPVSAVTDASKAQYPADDDPVSAVTDAVNWINAYSGGGNHDESSTNVGTFNRNPSENSVEQNNLVSNERSTVQERPKRTLDESFEERSNPDSKHDTQLESPDISIGSFFRNLKLGTSAISKRVSFANDRKVRPSKAHDGVASVSNRSDGIIHDNNLDDTTDRKKVIRRLRAMGKTFLLQRISQMTRLRDFLADEEHEELVNDFSNRLLWVKPLNYEFMDRSLPDEVVEKYVNSLIEANPKLPRSVGTEELDQNRNYGFDSGNPYFDDEEGGKKKRKRRRDAKRRNKDRAYRKRAVCFGIKLFRFLSEVYDKHDAEKAFDHIVTGHSIDLSRDEAFVEPGGRYSWHYIELHDALGNPIDSYSGGAIRRSLA